MEQPEAAGLQLASAQDRGGAGVAAFRAIKRRKMHKPIRKCNRLLFLVTWKIVQDKHPLLSQCDFV